jgi:hypothetical protein
MLQWVSSDLQFTSLNDKQPFKVIYALFYIYILLRESVRMYYVGVLNDWEYIESIEHHPYCNLLGVKVFH